MNSLKFLRRAGLIEGVTTLALFFVAMPLKYMFGFPSAVSIMGAIHGVAFLGYLIAMLMAVSGKGWSLLEIARTFFAAVIPFGTFLNDGFLKRKQDALAA